MQFFVIQFQQFFFRRICKNSDNQLFRIPNLVITNKVLNYSDFDEAHNKMAQKGQMNLIIRFIDEENTIVICFKAMCISIRQPHD